MITTRIDTIPPIGGEEAHWLALTEYGRLADLLGSLEGDDWTRPTDCPAWDVRAVAGHLVGEMSDFTSVRAVLRRFIPVARTAKTTGQEMVDVMTASQVADHADLTIPELIARIDSVSPVAARWRTTEAPGLFRRVPFKTDVHGESETWRMDYLLDVILTRDPWMHRIDIVRATGRDHVLTAEHDGRIVADVVAEWARRHGQPFSLTLTGTAGGEFVSGDGDGERLTMDAVEFCRTLSGRAEGSGLMARQVPF